MSSNTNPPTEQPTPEFRLGQFVYYAGTSIGIVSQLPPTAGEVREYRVDCVNKERKDISGGNVPVFREGYPKPVTEPADVLLCEWLMRQRAISRTKKTLERLVDEAASLDHSRNLLLQTDGTLSAE